MVESTFCGKNSLIGRKGLHTHAQLLLNHPGLFFLCILSVFRKHIKTKWECQLLLLSCSLTIDMTLIWVISGLQLSWQNGAILFQNEAEFLQQPVASQADSLWIVATFTLVSFDVSCHHISDALTFSVPCHYRLLLYRWVESVLFNSSSHAKKYQICQTELQGNVYVKYIMCSQSDIINI